MSDAMEMNERIQREAKARVAFAKKGPVIGGVEFPSPEDLRWRAAGGRGGDLFELDGLMVYGGPEASAGQARIEVRQTVLGTRAQAQRYYDDIQAAFAARKKAQEDREQREALEFVAKLARNPQL